ncbi:MAG TPA: hypothetical protein VG146_04825 [Verrucomicrobiae bacterium]|nr:hypothetical protein [Verrucomicrobiae bacterium]
MNRMDPELKRLLKWARRASPVLPEQAPFGFSGRVLASRKPPQAPTVFEELQSSAWGLSCAALVLILCGTLVFVSQRSAPSPAEPFSSALSFLVSNLSQ